MAPRCCARFLTFFLFPLFPASCLLFFLCPAIVSYPASLLLLRCEVSPAMTFLHSLRALLHMQLRSFLRCIASSEAWLTWSYAAFPSLASAAVAFNVADITVLMSLFRSVLPDGVLVLDTLSVIFWTCRGTSWMPETMCSIQRVRCICSATLMALGACVCESRVPLHQHGLDVLLWRIALSPFRSALRGKVMALAVASLLRCACPGAFSSSTLRCKAWLLLALGFLASIWRGRPSSCSISCHMASWFGARRGFSPPRSSLPSE